MDKSVYPAAKRGGYFAFRTLISPILIKVLYVLGAVAFLAAGVAVGIGYGERSLSALPLSSALGLPHWATGILIAVVGNIIWRVFCEALILFFSMHEILDSQERLLEAHIAVLEAKQPVGVK